MKLKFTARPSPVDIDPRSSAVVVVDMQNAFTSRGGMFDLAGLDISGAAKVTGVIRRILSEARESGMKIVYLQMGYKEDLSDSGGPESPNWYKELALLLMRRRPELSGRLLIEGSWDFSIVEELTPHSGDLVFVKSRYSGFAGGRLDPLLRAAGLRFLFFTGIAANVCVESTLRDAFFLDYWPILITDATMQAGPEFLQEATIRNVQDHFGWTMDSEEFLRSLKQGTGAGPPRSFDSFPEH